jgi:hypothetical protein
LGLGERFCNPSSDNDHNYNHDNYNYNNGCTTTTRNDARCANECVCDKF